MKSVLHGGLSFSLRTGAYARGDGAPGGGGGGAAPPGGESG
jgi:hypothetical protein